MSKNKALHEGIILLPLPSRRLLWLTQQPGPLFPARELNLGLLHHKALSRSILTQPSVKTFLLKLLFARTIIKVISHINPPCDQNFGEALAALVAASLAITLKLKNSPLKGTLSQSSLLFNAPPSLKTDILITLFQSLYPSSQLSL